MSVVGSTTIGVQPTPDAVAGLLSGDGGGMTNHMLTDGSGAGGSTTGMPSLQALVNVATAAPAAKAAGGKAKAKPKGKPNARTTVGAQLPKTPAEMRAAARALDATQRVFFL